MGKYEDLEKLQALKDSGGITEKEFEVEKYKILTREENKTKSKTEGIYIASLILGISTFLLGAIPILGLILGIIAIVITLKARKTMNNKEEKSGLVTAGLILSAIGLIIAVILTVVTVGILIYSNNNSVITKAQDIQTVADNGILSKAQDVRIAAEVASRKEYAVICAQDTLNNRIVDVTLGKGQKEEISTIKYLVEDNETIILIQTKLNKETTIYAYKETTFYGTDTTTGKISKEIKKWWNDGTEMDTDEILNKIE
jgi:hypothetical protein